MGDRVVRTNVPIDLSDEQRSVLADKLDGKSTKRLATRADVVSVCTRLLMCLLDDEVVPVSVGTALSPTNDFTTVDPEDRDALAGKSNSYIYGWNKVKRRHHGN